MRKCRANHAANSWRSIQKQISVLWRKGAGSRRRHFETRPTVSPCSTLRLRLWPAISSRPSRGRPRPRARRCR